MPMPMKKYEKSKVITSETQSNEKGKAAHVLAEQIHNERIS